MSSRRLIGLVATGGALALMAVAVTAAPSPGNVDAIAAEVADQRRALQQAETQRREALAQAAQLDTQAVGARDAAAVDRDRVAALALRMQAAEADLAAGRASLAIVDGAVRAQAERLAQQQAPVARLLASLQLLARRPPLTLFVEPGTASDMVHARAMMDAILPRIRARTAGLRAEVDRARALADVRRRAVNALAARTSSLGERRRQLELAAAASRARAERLTSNAGIESDRAYALAQDAGDIGQLLGTLQDAAATRDRLIALAGPVPRPGSGIDDRDIANAPPVSAAQPAYRLPVIGRVLAGLGEVGREGTRSRGLTIAVAPGSQVVAPAAGRIVYSGPFRSYGRIVIIDHGGGWTSLVTNMVAVTARVGETVAQGSPIGRTGPDQPHLTLELRRDGVPIDIATLVS